MPTSKRPQVDDVHYLRIPSRIMKGALHEEVVDDESGRNNVDLERMECRDTQISCMAIRSLAEPLEACRPQEGLKMKRPSTRKYLAGPLGAHRTRRPSFPT
jgi:hypothetical protein